MYIQCRTCERTTKDYLAYTHKRRKKKARMFNTEEELLICPYCHHRKLKGWILFRKFERWIDPRVVEFLVEKNPNGIKPHKLTLKELTKPLIAYTGMKKDGTPVKKPKSKLVTMAERKKITEKFGKQKFNTAISLKGGKGKTKPKSVTDNWLNWDMYDFKEEDLSTLI